MFSLPRVARAGATAAAAVFLTFAAAPLAAQAMPIQAAPQIDSAAGTGLETIQYRDWDRGSDSRRMERHREFRRWHRDREYRGWDRPRYRRDWDRDRRDYRY